MSVNPIGKIFIKQGNGVFPGIVGDINMEALITLNCSNYSSNIIDVLQAFQQIGWGIENSCGEVEFLPLGDNGMYEWLREEISQTKLYSIISNKIANKEQIGINLFNDNSMEGISFIADSTEQIILSLSINRKVIKGKYTDLVWYLENIVYKLFDIGVDIRSYILEEYGD